MDNKLLLYKPTGESYSGAKVDPKKSIGVWQLRQLQRDGFKTHDSERLMAFYYCCYFAKKEGFDYVVLSASRTNSGRAEAVKVTSRCANTGEKLAIAGYAPTPREAYDHPSKICFGDVFIPQEPLPKKYNSLPAYNPESERKEAHEDELLALIDCVTGKGDKAKAFRAIARFLVGEAINLEQDKNNEVS